MPSISRFAGMVVYMYHDDHNPPHFHVIAGDDEAQIAINTPAVIVGSLSRRQERLVLAWAARHIPELQDNWVRAHTNQALLWIEP